MALLLAVKDELARPADDPAVEKVPDNFLTDAEAALVALAYLVIPLVDDRMADDIALACALAFLRATEKPLSCADNIALTLYIFSAI